MDIRSCLISLPLLVVIFLETLYIKAESHKKMGTSKRLSLKTRARAMGFLLATISMNLGYFHKEQKENRKKKELSSFVHFGPAF